VEIPDTSGLPFDLLIFSPACIAFVKVMRMRGRVTDPPDALVYQSGSVIRKLRIVPKSAVAVMELWVLSSHATWQYFRVMPDRIVEIRSDGSMTGGIPIDGSCVVGSPPADSAIAGTGQIVLADTAVPPANADIPAPNGFPLPESPPGDAVPIVSRTDSET
jgi:hypothetical protein